MRGDVADVEAMLTAALEAGDAGAVLALVETVDWRGMDTERANEMLRRVALYGCSGRTQRYAGAVQAMLAQGLAPDLASCAVLLDNEQAIRILDAAPDALEQADANGARALHHAAERGNAALVAVLCERGADVNAVDERGATALDHALHAGPWKTSPATDVVAVLRQHGANVDFWTLAALGDAERLRAMLDEGAVEVDQHDGKGCTALYHAAHNNHPAAVAALLDAGADPNGACADGQTALTTACLHMLSQECDIDIVRTLVDAGAKPDAANWAHIERIAGDDAALVQDLRRRERKSR